MSARPGAEQDEERVAAAMRVADAALLTRVAELGRRLKGEGGLSGEEWRELQQLRRLLEQQRASTAASAHRDAGVVATQKAAASVLGVSARTLRTWKHERGFPGRGDGAYDVEAIRAWQAERAAGRSGAGAGEDWKQQETKWKARCRELEAELKTLDLRVRHGELIERSAVVRKNVGQIVAMKRVLLGMGRKLGARLAGQPALVIQRGVNEEVRHAIGLLQGPQVSDAVLEAILDGEWERLAELMTAEQAEQE